MNEKVEVPVDLPNEVESMVQKIALQSGYTRDEVIERCLLTIFEMADSLSDKIDRPAFIFAIKKSLEKSGPAA